MNNQIVYNLLCAFSNIFGINPGADLTQSLLLYPEIYALAAGESNANSSALLTATTTAVVRPAALVNAPAEISVTAIAGSFADLPAANTAVATLKSEVQNHLLANRAAIVSIIEALQAAGLMAAE